MHKPAAGLIAGILALAAAGCTGAGPLPENAGVGPNPVLPEPHSTLLPTINIAPAIGWPAGATPIAALGLVVRAYAAGLEHPRMLHVLPNGDVLVAESNAPAEHDATRGVIANMKAAIAKMVMKSAGAGVASPDRIVLLRGINADGTAKSRSVFLDGLHSPFGMALIGDNFYVANTDAVLRFTYHRGDQQIAGPGVKVVDLPAGATNHHWTKDLLASPDGQRLYASIGSNSNVGENGIDQETGRAGILEINVASGQSRMFASGIRNPNGLSWEKKSGTLWAVVNERDELGDDLVPDYLTSIRDGGFYGWPYSYYGQHLDNRIKPPRPDLVATAIAPDYALGSHVAPLGLAFYNADLLPKKYTGGAFVGEHGSWNRKPHSGYKVVFIPFADGRPAGLPQDVLTGFLNGESKAQGRPVGVAVDGAGALLVADDVGKVIWRVTPEQ